MLSLCVIIAPRNWKYQSTTLKIIWEETWAHILPVFIGRPKYSCSKWLYGCSVLSMVVQNLYFWTRKNGRDNPTPLLNNHRHFFEQPLEFFWTTIEIFLNNLVHISEQPFLIIWTTQNNFWTRIIESEQPYLFFEQA